MDEISQMQDLEERLDQTELEARHLRTSQMRVSRGATVYLQFCALTLITRLGGGDLSKGKRVERE